MTDISTRIAKLDSQLIRLGRGREFELHSQAKRRGRAVLVRVHHAHYLPVEVWESLDPGDRQLARMAAVRAAAEREPVFSGPSAAALLGLPLFHRFDETVHLAIPNQGSGRTSAGVVRHRVTLDAADVVRVGDFCCTSASRTILDLACSFSSEDALVSADAYLRDEFRVFRRVDEQRLEEWRADMRHRFSTLKGRRGIRSAREVLLLADPRKDSALESISHLRLDRLGFAVELQVPVAGPKGETFHVDFRFVGLKLLGECDGKSKYTDERFLNGQTANDRVYADKRRQDWVCGSLRSEMIRWGYPEVATDEAFMRMLRAFNVPIPPTPRAPQLRR